MIIIMSFDVRQFRAASDENVPSFLRTPENGTTTAIRHNTIYEFGLLGKGARIINNDVSNNLDVRLHSPRNPIMVIPPNSELLIEEWFAEIHCEPDGTTGSFQLTLEVANQQDAMRIRR